MFKYAKILVLIIFDILYWFFPNLLSNIFRFESNILFLVVILGSVALGFLAGKTFLKEETIEKNVNRIIWVFLIYFFISGFIIWLVSLNLFSFDMMGAGEVTDFLPLLTVVFILGSIWFLFQLFNGFNIIFITPFLIGFYLRKAIQKSS